jgi:trimethylamine:corrinoid methyltransferase-like protein
MSKHIKSISNPKLKLEVLTTEEVKKIHEATLWIIENVGIRFPSQRALEIWEANGATVDREKKIVRVKGDVIEAVSVTDADGNTYADFCLGDTGAMAGHGATADQAHHRLR